MIILITKDLFFVPVIRSACENLETQLVVATRAEGEKLDDVPQDQVAASIVDLSSVAATDVEQSVSRLRERFPAALVVAFGPHVQTGRLAAAEEAQCDQILTRGQLSSQIERLVASWLSAKQND